MWKRFEIEKGQRNKQFSAPVSASTQSSKRRACDSFADFKSKKTEERALNLRDGKGKGKRGRTSSSAKEVVINIGIMKHDPSGTAERYFEWGG